MFVFNHLQIISNHEFYDNNTSVFICHKNHGDNNDSVLYVISNHGDNNTLVFIISNHGDNNTSVLYVVKTMVTIMIQIYMSVLKMNSEDFTFKTFIKYRCFNTDYTVTV
ncbi:hypothetical protein KUTeg_013607 [Tegillarca granosa]|uniref:Uncharacterized protein n=1 Tax=Tegillarca granosa TaxID=220873 RepID=A0ABQ9EU70_TEGGR|nr:hypothetical protein KUTeg_013607 [Tegillarca granosa]